MPCWIENVAKDEVAKGMHFDPGPNSLLICINDPGMQWVEPKFKFNQIVKFEFLDLEDTDTWCPEHVKFSDKQAERLVEILQIALAKRMNVVVHCTAGVCRSGAIVEVATMMGFTDTEKWRSPNLRVKHKMMKALGLTFDPAEQHVVKPGHYDILDPRGEIGNA